MKKKDPKNKNIPKPRQGCGPVSDRLSLGTKGIHGKKLYAYQGPVSTPIYQTSNYRFADSGDAMRYAEGDKSVYVYSRYHNPTVHDVEEKIALMEDGDDAILFSSGMAAISTLIMTFAGTGDNIVSTPALYGGTYRFFRDVLPRHGVDVRYVDPSRNGDWGEQIDAKTKIVYFETPTNPTLAIVDIAQLVHRVKKAEQKFKIKILTVIDNTFATIFNQRPFEFGVDAVIESGTKYLGGHSDLLSGVVVASDEIIDAVRTSAKYYGGCADPFMAYLLMRSLKTFHLRVERQNYNALLLASFFEKHQKVKRVLYPGLESHPHHAIAKKQMTGFGGMATIEVPGGADGAARLCDALHIAVNAMSLGGVETLVSIPVYSSHVNMKTKELARHGVTPGMVRISAGVEGIQDLIDDFDQALEYV